MGIDKAIDDMRRRRRRMFSMKGLVGAAKSASDAALKDLKKGLDSASDKLEKDVKGQIKELDGLTGGKLTDGLNKYFCPAATTALSDVIGTTLLSAGWTFGTPKCVDDAIEKGCESLVKAATKRNRRNFTVRANRHGVTVKRNRRNFKVSANRHGVTVKRNRRLGCFLFHGKWACLPGRRN